MEVSFERIKRPATLSQEIVQNIERSILERKLVPGQKLPTEQELCDMFSVSRTAVREALRMLSAKGLVTIRKRSGIFVNDMTSADVSAGLDLYLKLKFDKDYILYVFSLRQALEPHVARWAAEQRSMSDVWEMEKVILRMSECPPEERETESRLDQEFHAQIAAATKNPMVPLVLQPVFSLMPKIRAMVYAYIPDCVSSALDHHRRILNAIRQRDGEAAYQAMQIHISSAAGQASEVIDIINKGVPSTAEAARSGREA